LAEGSTSGSKSTAAKEELPTPTTMDAVDGRSGLGRRCLLWVTRREGPREGEGWDLGDWESATGMAAAAAGSKFKLGIFSSRVRVRRK
jgi:hypothetical protein